MDRSRRVPGGEVRRVEASMWGCFYAGEVPVQPFALFGDEASAERYARDLTQETAGLVVYVLPCFVRCEAWDAESEHDETLLQKLVRQPA